MKSLLRSPASALLLLGAAVLPLRAQFPTSITFSTDEVATGTLTLADGDELSFISNASAGSATITSRYTTFTDQATAANATLNNTGDLAFMANATAGSASITNVNGSTLTFSDSATAAAATITNGVADIRVYMSGGVTLSIGSLSGDGTLMMGTSAVTVGALNTSTDFAGEISGDGPFKKTGTGTLSLYGANTYGNGTVVLSGTLVARNSTGSAFGTGAVTVNAGATLTGAGAFTGALQNNGTYAPGNSPGLVTLSAFTQGSTGLLALELGGLVRGTGYDALDITGAASFGGALEVTFYNGFGVTGGESFDLFNWASRTGTFATLTLPALTGGLGWDTSTLYTNGILSVTSSAIPEPSTYAALLGMGACLAVVLRRRRLATP